MNRLACFLAVVVLVWLNVNSSVESNPLKLLKELSRFGDEATTISRNTDDALRLGNKTDDVLVFGNGNLNKHLDWLTDSQRKEISSAFGRMQWRSAVTYESDAAAISKLLAIAQTKKDEFSRAIAFSNEYPGIKIRGHIAAEFDGPTRNFARARYEPVFSSPFDVDDLRVVTLGLSDDSVLSAQEATRYGRTLGREISDRVGPLSTLDPSTLRTSGDYSALFAPYKGKTIVIVGHIPDDLGSFFVFRNGVREHIDIGRLMSAARDANVNLIPVGCNSERLTSLGAEGIVNSGDILDRIVDIVKSQPDTVGAFFQKLTYNDLTLIVDPLRVRFHSNAAEIVTRLQNRKLGYLAFETFRGGIRLSRSWSDYRKELEVQWKIEEIYDPCFTSASVPSAFNKCVTQNLNDAKNAKELAAQKAEMSAVQNRNERRMEIPTEIAAIIDKEKRNFYQLVVSVSAYILIIAISTAVFVVSLTTAHWNWQEHGWSFRRVYAFRRFKEAALLFGYAFHDLREDWFLVLLVLSAIIFSLIAGHNLPLVFANHNENILENLLFGKYILTEYEVISNLFSVLAFKIYGLAIWSIIFLFWSAIKERDPTTFIAAISPLAIIGSAILISPLIASHQSISNDMDMLFHEAAELHLTLEQDKKMIENGSLEQLFRATEK